MPTAASGLAGAATRTPADRAGTGAGDDDASLASLLGEEDSASAQETGDGTADADSTEADNDLSQDGSSDGQDSDPADSEAGDEDGEEAPKRNKVQERIDKLTARAKDAEERATAAEAKLKKIEAGESPAAETARGFDPIEDEPSVVKLNEAVGKAEREAKSARDLRRKLRTEPDKVLELLKSKGIELEDSDAAYDWLEEYEGKSRDEWSDARAKLVEHKAELKGVVANQTRAWAAAAETKYAWLKDDEDPRHEYITKAEQTYPWLKKLPAGRAALAALADMVYEAKAANGRKPEQAAQRKPGVRPSNGGGGPTGGRVGALTDSNRRRANFEARLDQNPDDDEAMAGLLESGLGG